MPPAGKTERMLSIFRGGRGGITWHSLRSPWVASIQFTGMVDTV